MKDRRLYGGGVGRCFGLGDSNLALSPLHLLTPTCGIHLSRSRAAGKQPAPVGGPRAAHKLARWTGLPPLPQLYQLEDPSVDRDLQVTLPPVADYLFYNPTIVNAFMQNAVTGLGKTFAVASAAQFNIMTVADFKKYKAIVFTDPRCSGLPIVAGAMASRAVWSAAVDGNVIVLGTDEVYHWTQGGAALATNGLEFAADTSGKTGLYFSLSCYYEGASPTSIPILENFGVFTAVDAPGCFNNAHIVATHPVTDGISDASISNWFCSVHNVLPAYPHDFIPLAIARRRILSFSSSLTRPLAPSRDRTRSPLPFTFGATRRLPATCTATPAPFPRPPTG
jgi:hypothetical protein